MSENTDSRSTLQKRLWRKPSPPESVARANLYTRRALYLMGTLLALAAIATLLTLPSRQPRTHIFIFEDRIPDFSRVEHLIAIPPLAYSKSPEEIFAELREVSREQTADGDADKNARESDPAASKIPRAYFDSLEKIANFGPAIQRKIQTNKLDDRDSVIVYLRAQGLVKEGEPLLLLHSGKPQAPIDHYPIDELLDDLPQTRGTVLLLIDFGTIQQDAWNGVAINDFVPRLRELITARNQKNLWVATSHGVLESSLVSDQHKRSIFEHVVCTGLAGASDLNSDGWVDVQELFSHVHATIPTRVAIQTSGRQSQRPQFMWGGGDQPQPSDNARLVSVDHKLWKEVSTAQTVQRGGFVPAFNWNSLLSGQTVRASNKSQATSRTAKQPENNGNSSPPQTKGEPVESDATQSSNDAEEKPDSDSETVATKTTTVELSQTLFECWKIYETLSNSGTYGETFTPAAMPMSFYAPAVWNDLESLLVYATDIAARPGSADIAALNTLLVQQVLPLAKFDPARPLENAVGLARRLDSKFPRSALEWPNPNSFEVALWVAQFNQQERTAQLSRMIASFNAALAANTKDQMEKWLHENQAVVSKFEEPAMCQRLLRKNVDWSMCQLFVENLQLAIRSRLAGGFISDYLDRTQLHADELAQYSLQLAVQLADTNIDQNAVARTDEIIVSLRKSNALYDASITFSDQLSAAFNRAWRDYVELHATQLANPAISRERTTNPENPETDPIRSLEKAVIRLQNARSLSELTLKRSLLAQFGGWPLPDQRSDSLVHAKARRRLAAIGTLSEAEDKGDHPAAKTLAAGIDSLSTLASPQTMTTYDWRTIQNYIDQEFAQSQLAQQLWKQPVGQFLQLKKTHQKLSDRFKQQVASKNDSIDHLTTTAGNWQSIREFALANQLFLRALEKAEIEDSASNSGVGSLEFTNLRYRCESDVGPNNNMGSTSHTHFWGRRLSTICRGLRRRLVTQTAIDVLDFQERKNKAAGIQPRFFDETVPIPEVDNQLPLQISAPSIVDLGTKDSTTATISIRSTAAVEEPLWILTSRQEPAFVIESIEEKSPTATRIPVASFQRVKNSSEGDIEKGPLSAWASAIRQSFEPIRIPSDKLIEVELRFSKQQRSTSSQKVELQIVCADRLFLLPIWVNCGRQDPVRLDLTSKNARTLPTASGWQILMAPNTNADLHLKARNFSSSPQNISVSVLATSQKPTNLPPISVPLEKALSIEQTWPGKKQIFVKQGIEVPADATDLKITAPDFVSVGSDESVAKPKKDGDADASTNPIGPYLLLRQHNHTLNQVIFVPLETRVVHPREYVRPVVSFDSASRKLVIKIDRTSTVARQPRDIDIRAELSMESGTDSTITVPLSLAANAQATSFESKLSGDMGPILSLTLSIDGYPRAFRYVIDTRRSARELPLSTKSAIRILSPPSKFVVPNKDTLVDVQLQADVGFTSAGPNQSLIEFGLDVDRDRDFYNEPVVRLLSDRAVLLFNESQGAALGLSNRLTDLRVQVPVDTLANRRINLLGHLRNGLDDLWSQPVEIVLDKKPPRVTDLTVGSQAIVGKPLSVTFAADDDKLSGIAMISALIDFNRAGKITPESELVDAKRNENGVWSIEFSTDNAKAEAYFIIAMATDRAGNTSQEFRSLIKFVTEEQIAAMENAPTKIISGQVMYGKSSVPEASVTLVDDQDETVAETETDEFGKFTIKELKPGTYKLSVRGVSRGKIRKLEESVVITPKNSETVLKLKLP